MQSADLCFLCDNSQWLKNSSLAYLSAVSADIFSRLLTLTSTASALASVLLICLKLDRNLELLMWAQAAQCMSALYVMPCDDFEMACKTGAL